MVGYVYILECNNGRYYVGSTSDIARRFDEHMSGKNKATQNLLPVRLLFYKNYSTLLEARRMERKLKKWKSKTVLQKIILDKDIEAR